MAMEQRDCWGAAVAWAGAPRAALALPGPLAMLRRERAAITAAADAAADVRALRLPVPLARALYRGLWADRWERKAEAWLLRRSAGRRWLSTGGDEWRWLPAAGTYGPAFHVLRALCGGLRGPAGARSVVVRDGRPWCCSVCAASGARWAWRTPGPTVPGLAFCADCLGGRARPGSGYLVALRLLGCSSGQAGLAGVAHPEVLGGAWSWIPSEYGACPLCGLGEGRAEHLLLWCPAIALAWRLLAAGCENLLAEVVSGAEGPANVAALLLHQASFLHLSLQRRASMQWEAAGRWLVRACGPRGYRAWAALDGDDGAGDDDDLDVQGLGAPGPDFPSWEHGADQDCATCRRLPPPPRCLRSSARPDLGRRELCPSGAASWRPIADVDIADGQCLAVLCGDEPRCQWPIGAGRWWPPPRVVGPGLARARWIEERCVERRRHRVSLVALGALTQGQEVTVGTRISPGGDGDRAYGLEATFDGGVRDIHGARVGGAGAVLWGVDPRDGLLRRVASASMALPEVTDSQVAEAWGAHLVVLLLHERPDGERRVRISGDNLAVVRHCAAQGRLHSPCAQAVLEPALARLAAEGWRVSW